MRLPLAINCVSCLTIVPEHNHLQLAAGVRNITSAPLALSLSVSLFLYISLSLAHSRSLSLCLSLSLFERGRPRGPDTLHAVKAAHPSGRARSSAGAGCSAVKYQSLGVQGLGVSPSVIAGMAITRLFFSPATPDLKKAYMGTSLIRNSHPS